MYYVKYHKVQLILTSKYNYKFINQSIHSFHIFIILILLHDTTYLFPN